MANKADSDMVSLTGMAVSWNFLRRAACWRVVVILMKGIAAFVDKTFVTLIGADTDSGKKGDAEGFNGTEIMLPEGAKVVAPTPGVIIVTVEYSEEGDTVEIVTGTVVTVSLPFCIAGNGFPWKGKLNFLRILLDT